ncbi:MAG: UvrB/UvrC motif-containing protein [Verrucomicrobiia bacterium]
MSDSSDLRSLFDAWPFDAADDLRVVRGDDGRELLQVRMPLGIEQYEVDGRPDGHRPHEMESELEFHLARLAKAKKAGEEAGFKISAEDCVELFSESVLYYYRYVRFFQLKDWPRTVRDTKRNLRVFDLVQRYAERTEDRVQLEQWRPYVLRMNTVARAMIALDNRQHETARKIVAEALEGIESLPELDNPTFQFERDRSMTALRDLAKQIERSRPLSELERLQQQLKEAVETEQFERAADLRDRIRDFQAKVGVV